MSMKVQDLRIHNNLKQGFVRSIYYDGTVGLDDGYSYKLEDLEPIPLSPEWLTRFEFEFNEEGAKYLDAIVYDHKYTSFRLFKYHGSDKPFHYELRAQARRYVLYVHDLQNLFHSIQGEELTLKP